MRGERKLPIADNLWHKQYQGAWCGCCPTCISTNIRTTGNGIGPLQHMVKNAALNHELRQIRLYIPIRTPLDKAEGGSICCHRQYHITQEEFRPPSREIIRFFSKFRWHFILHTIKSFLETAFNSMRSKFDCLGLGQGHVSDMTC